MNSLEILQYFSEYEAGVTPLLYNYSDQHDNSLVGLRKYVNLNLNSQSDLEKAHILLNYTYSNLIPGNEDYASLRGECNSLYILSRTQTHRVKSNCYMYCVVLTELLLCYGIKARLIICRPFDFVKNLNCHCMVHAYIKGIDKWIALDPANCASFRDDNGEFISISDIRKKIINKENYHVFCSPDNDVVELKKYLPYYLFSFFSFESNGYNLYASDESNRVNVLLPALFKPPIDLSLKERIVFDDKAFWEN